MKDGGPAFPVVSEYGEKVESSQGMTLRDYFAAKAMQAFWTEGVASNHNFAADWAYKQADAMLRARETSND